MPPNATRKRKGPDLTGSDKAKPFGQSRTRFFAESLQGKDLRAFRKKKRCGETVAAELM